MVMMLERYAYEDTNERNNQTAGIQRRGYYLAISNNRMMEYATIIR